MQFPGMSNLRWPQFDMKLLEHKHIIYHFEAGDMEIPNI